MCSSDLQGVGRPFREIVKRLFPLTPKARASVGADGWGDDPKTILLSNAFLTAAGLRRFLTRVCFRVLGRATAHRQFGAWP